MKTYSISRTIDAPVEKAWKVVGDPELYHEVAPTIGKIEMMSDSRRKCYDAKLEYNWEEDMVDYIEGRKYSMQVDPSSMKDSSGDPASYPLKSMKGTWEVEPIDNTTTKITMRFDYEMKFGIIGSLLHIIMRVPKTFEQMTKPIMDNYERRIVEMTTS